MMDIKNNFHLRGRPVLDFTSYLLRPDVPAGCNNAVQEITFASLYSTVIIYL